MLPTQPLLLPPRRSGSEPKNGKKLVRGVIFASSVTVMEQEVAVDVVDVVDIVVVAVFFVIVVITVLVVFVVVVVVEQLVDWLTGLQTKLVI